MKELVLQVRESEYDFVLKLLKQLASVKILDTPAAFAPISEEKLEVLRSIRQGLQEVRMIQRGELPRRSLSHFLSELD